jgi:serine/threonine protein kinase
MLVGERSIIAAEQAITDPLVGKRLRHFEITRLLGRGGMGAVYLGQDTSLDRPVALKVLDPELAHDPDVVARFEREARAQARLRHPNVAQIHFIGEEDHIHFFAMERLEGPPLDVVLARGERLPWPDALENTLAAARGLRAALAHGFVHRDVKPSNLMLDPDSRIKILDFGLVKSMRGDAELTADGAIVGSPLYMAPEQGRAENVDHRADIYSLGCALYHMLTGHPPFSGPSPVGIITMHVTDRPSPARQFAPDVPEALERILERMMAKLPADRFADYDVLIAALEAARPGARTLSGFRQRALALAIDIVPLAVVAWFAGAWALLAATLYFVLGHRLFGRTLGKWALGLRVTDRMGKRLSWKTAFLRFAASAWGLIVAYLSGFLVAAFHPQRRALHDLLAGTEVRRVR